MNLKQLEFLVAELRLAPPRPVALWFVDRPTRFNWLLRVAGDEINHLAFPYRFLGIPVYNVRTDHSPQDKFYVTPIYQKPGVWIEMSDGNHHRVRLADEARRAATEAENKWRDALRKRYTQQGGDDADTAPKDSSS